LGNGIHFRLSRKVYLRLDGGRTSQHGCCSKGGVRVLVSRVLRSSPRCDKVNAVDHKNGNKRNKLSCKATLAVHRFKKEGPQADVLVNGNGIVYCFSLKWNHRPTGPTPAVELPVRNALKLIIPGPDFFSGPAGPLPP
jgi:hypothetical protein